VMIFVNVSAAAHQIQRALSIGGELACAFKPALCKTDGEVLVRLKYKQP